jgi:hypothetical protein
MLLLFRSVLLLACLWTGLNVVAEEVKIKPQIQGDVEFVSGGVGEHERSFMQSLQGNYNVHILFAIKGTGEYVSDVKVKIMDGGGITVLDTIAAGPKLFVKLSPGRYKLEAERQGRILQETINVPSKKGTTLSLYWPKNKAS